MQRCTASSDQVPALSAANKETCHRNYRDHHGLEYAEKSEDEHSVERQGQGIGRHPVNEILFAGFFTIP